MKDGGMWRKRMEEETDEKEQQERGEGHQILC